MLRNEVKCKLFNLIRCGLYRCRWCGMYYDPTWTNGKCPGCGR